MKNRPGGTRPPVDWEAIKQRLAGTADALKNEFAPTAEQRREILHARAQKLAQEAPAEIAPDTQIEVLEFVLAQERYAFETSLVREVHPLKDLTPLPCTPRFVLGIANVRGRIMSVIDIKKFFDLAERSLTDLNKIIILQDGAMEFGVLADLIIGTRWLRPSELQPSLPTLTGIRADYLRGITAQRLVVLDAKKLLNDPAVVVDQEVAP